MGNIVTTIKRFLANKNTVTIIGVLLGLVVLYIGYNYRVEQAVDTVFIPYARETISASSEITSDAVGTMEVLRSFANNGSVIANTQEVINTTSPYCVNYGTSIPQGAFFYKEQVTPCSGISNNILKNMPDGYAPFSLSVDIHTTFGNSMYPGDYIDLYVKMSSSDNKIIFGKFIEKIQILDVRDNNGVSVFLTSDIKTPSELLFAVPEDLLLLLYKASYVNTVEIIPIPRNAGYTVNPGETAVSSEYLRQQIERYTADIPDEDVNIPTIE